MIKLQVIGNLGRDCVVNNVNGKNVINFSVAHTEKFKDNTGVQKDRTIWVECAYWTERTAIAPYLKKGTQVYVEGSPDIRTYQTQDGRQGASLSLRVQNVQLLGQRNTGDQAVNDGGASYSSPQANTYQPAQQQQQSYSQPAALPNDLNSPLDDLPF